VGGTFIEQWTPNASIASCQNTLCGTPTLNWELCGSLFNGNIAPFINQTVGGWVWCECNFESSFLVYSTEAVWCQRDPTLPPPPSQALTHIAPNSLVQIKEKIT
jgi:hypothetical protein